MEYRYVGEPGVERYYSEQALTVVDGDDAEWPDGPPDQNWTPVDATSARTTEDGR